VSTDLLTYATAFSYRHFMPRNEKVFLFSTQSQHTPGSRAPVKLEWQFTGSLFIIALQTPYIFYHYILAHVNKLAFIAHSLPVQIGSDIRNVKVSAKCSARDRGEEYGRNIIDHSL